RSESEIEARDQIAHLRLREEVALREIGLTNDVHLGVEACVLRPGRQVAAGERERQAAAPNPSRQAGRRIERERELAPLHEARILDVPTEERAARHIVGDGIGALRRRCGLVIQSAADRYERQTAELLA